MLATWHPLSAKVDTNFNDKRRFTNSGHGVFLDVSISLTEQQIVTFTELIRMRSSYSTETTSFIVILIGEQARKRSLEVLYA
jgi:hypothetical protein